MLMQYEAPTAELIVMMPTDVITTSNGFDGDDVEIA